MFVVPAHLFNPETVRAGVTVNTISGGTSLSDIETVIQTDGGGRWQIEWSGIDIDAPETERLWSMWASHLRGGAQPILVPLLSLSTAPRPYVGWRDTPPSDLLFDDEAFPTVVQFASPHIVARVTSAAPLRATTVEIEVVQGARLRGGEKFSVGRRAYPIERVIARDGQKATCLLGLPLREPIEAGATANFEWPVVQCRAQVGQDLTPEMQFGMYSTVSISFVEDFSDAN